MKRRALLFLIPGSLLAFTACEEFDPYLPTVSFDDFTVRQIDFEQIGVDFAFAIDNPHPVSIDLAAFDYQLSLQDISLITGDAEDGFTLEANGASPLVIPVDLAFLDTWNVVEATRGVDTIDYSLSGSFGFNTPIGQVDLPYRELGGDFPALRTPVFSLQALRLDAFDLFALDATLALDLGVDNAHESSLFFEAFHYTLDLAGEPVVSGVVDNLGEVAGAQGGTFTLPIEVDLLKASLGIVDALTFQKPIDVGLVATMDVSTPFGVIPLDLDLVQLLPID
jgi:LEA14-like dessication related protein